MATLDHMASHGDKTMAARFIISDTYSYPAGVVVALVHKVNSFFLEPELEHQSRATASAGNTGVRKVVVSDVRPYQGDGHEIKVDDASVYKFLGHYQSMFTDLKEKRLEIPQ